jgi:predicted LPLAT superfamily acyltransferase
MTPDIAQKDRDQGVDVRLLGHAAQLPSGPASIAMLAEAPIVPVFGRVSGKTHTIYSEAPLYVLPRTRAEGGRRAALRDVMQKWADLFSEFVRACPQAWFLWGDSRWTKVFRGDPRYSGDETPGNQEIKTSKQAAGGLA